MGSPDVPDPEPPYRPWPGEQLPYTPSTASPGDFTEPAPPSRRRLTWLRVAALTVAVLGISTGAVLFTQGDDGSTRRTGPGVETTDEPSGDPTDEPTDEPSGDPTDEPTDEPSGDPTDEPTDEPTDIEPSESESESDPGSEETYVDDLAVGDCADKTESISYLQLVPCDGTHDVQTLAKTELDDGFGYPGDDAIDEEARSLCGEAYGDASENWTSDEEERLGWTKVVPNDETWELGDRTVVCFLEAYFSGETLEEDWLNYSSF